MIGKLGAGSKGQISEENCFENRTIQLWNQVPTDALGTLSYKPNYFRKMVRKVINQVK
jgi:hypothetical protein